MSRSKLFRLAGMMSTALLWSYALAAQAQPMAYEDVFRDHHSSYILVFAYPSAAWLDWSSPSKLSATSVQSAVVKRMFSLPTTIGHAQFAWSCRQPDGQLISQGASGQSGENNGQSLAALSKGWGMSILELVFTDGNLEYDQEVNQRILNGAAKNQFSWAGFKVPTESCMKLVNFVEKYQAAGAYTNYGFPVDPLKYQGAGCTSYANAALERSDAPLPFRDAWVRHYQIPESQLGRNGEPPAHTAIVPAARIPDRKLEVPLTDFLFGDRQWAKENEASIRFEYYDPELFYESFLHLENGYRQTQGMPLKPAVRTASLDGFQQQLKTRMTQWMQTLQANKTPMQLDKIAGESGLIVDLRK